MADGDFLALSSSAAAMNGTCYPHAQLAAWPSSPNTPNNGSLSIVNVITASCGLSYPKSDLIGLHGSENAPWGEQVPDAVPLATYTDLTPRPTTISTPEAAPILHKPIAHDVAPILDQDSATPVPGGEPVPELTTFVLKPAAPVVTVPDTRLLPEPGAALAPS